MTKDELIEHLAAIEHERWSDWQKWLHTQGTKAYVAQEGLEAILALPMESVQRWERQIDTPYAELTEREKQSDREQVARYWPLIETFVLDWLSDRAGDCPNACGHLAAEWLETVMENA